MSGSLVARARRSLAVSEPRKAAVQLVVDAGHYDQVVCELPGARVAVWIATANLKDLHVEAAVGTRARAAGRYVSILDGFEALAQRGVELRVLHGRAPSGPFQSALRARPTLRGKLRLRECPRVHMKLVIIDGRLLYLGSANFTGAGIGARGDARRNFELGIVTDDVHLLDVVQARFDAIWTGRECAACGLRRECPKPIDTLDPGA